MWSCASTPQGQALRNGPDHVTRSATAGRARGTTQPRQSRKPTVWGAGRGQPQHLTLIQANPDTCASTERLEQLDALFWRKYRADLVGLQEVRRDSDNNAGVTCGDGHYTLYHSRSDGPNLGVGILVPAGRK